MILKVNTSRFFKKLASVVFLCICFANIALAQKVTAFKAQEVKLLPSIFKNAEQTDLRYMLALDADKLLAPYLREAGLPAKTTSYTNWENTGLDGHIGGHYLTALSLMYASTSSPKVGDRLNYMLTELKRCQDKNGNGYIGGVPGSNALWQDIANGKIQVGTFDLNKKWVPLYNIHKTIAGLKDAYVYTKNPLAKQMLVDYGNWFVWLTSKLSDEQIQRLLISEYGGLNEVFADLYQITSDKKYLKLAYQFSDLKILNPLAKQEDKLSGLHANTQIPKVIGFKRIATVGNDKAYNTASKFFWETVINNRTVALGGNSVREHFNPTNDFSTMITSVEGPETCNSYNMLKLTKLLYEDEGLSSYMDYYERTLYNHILSSQHPTKGGFVYFTPMRPGHYRVYSQPQTSFWCCVGSGLENHAKYNELIYAHSDEELFVNLFIPSAVNWEEKGFSLVQNTSFPETETTLLTIQNAGKGSVALQIRYPNWVKLNELKVKVNGKTEKITAKPGSYVKLQRVWKKGDQIEIVLPMHIKAEPMPGKSPYVALLNGPILLAAKTDSTNLTGLFADDSRMGHIAGGTQYPLQDMPLFVSNQTDYATQVYPVKGKSQTFKASNLIYPAAKKNLELIPFYKLHDSRYIVYWQTVNESGLVAMKAQLAKEEAEKAKLLALTIDMVYPGEQQPESDHFIEMENSQNGTHRDRHWRTAKGWFSYQLANPKKESAVLRLTYFGRDANRNFRVLINDKEIAKVSLDGKMGDKFYEVDYQIPTEITNKTNKLKVKFIAENGSETAGIYELRLMRHTNNL
ncbi:glycoside hydrolase family 127 protein [Pedobacter namyangjuensis]|uniref:glycoside hydrolase family 127 protein n=1 Tax=Pedobacter namyangjuensis TaxID=600626 RepID=UPI000DE53E91|nr:glycoside hydrolase family 127 protein [Pedobacter namyangjuensis]